MRLRRAVLAGCAALTAVTTGGCAPAGAFPAGWSTVDAEMLRPVLGADVGSRTFGPLDLAQVRTDYGSCDDGLRGTLRPLSHATAATGSAVVTDSREPGAVAEVVSLVARMPDSDEADLVATGRRECGAAAGVTVEVAIDGRTERVTRLDGGGPEDRLGVLVTTSRVGLDVIVVLVAFNGAEPGAEVAAVLAAARRSAVDLVPRR